MSATSLLPLLAGTTLIAAIALPLLRSWLRYRTFALLPPGTELQRFLHGSFAFTLLGYGLWSGLLQVLGSERLGVLAVPAPVALVGLAVGLAGLGVVVIAQAQMGASWRIGIDDQPTPLVTHGLFRVSRNPIYLGMLLLTVGVALVAPSGWTVVGGLLAYVVVGFQARAEEEHLARLHGDAFVAWASRVGRFLPWFGRLGAR